MPADTPMVLVPRGELETLQRSIGLGSLLPGEGELLIECWLRASPAREGDYGPVISMETRGPIEDARRRREAEDAYYGARWPAPSPGEGDAPVAWREALNRIAGQVCKPFARPDDESDIFNDGVRAMRDALLIHSAGWEGGLLNPTPATPEGEELPLGTPVEVVFSEPEVGRQVLYVAGAMIGEPGMTEPEYWLSDTWPVKSRGDITTDWKREQFTPLAALQPQAGEGE